MMAKGGVVFTNDNEYYTPKYVVDYFGQFDYDPATVAEKAKEFGIKDFDTVESDGLSKDWTTYKRIWINPPFTRKHEFLAKAQATYDKVKNEIYVLFPIEFLTTQRFIKVCRGGATIHTKWKNKLSKWSRKARQITSVWECCLEITGHKRSRVHNI
jgi:hypothetical protein